MSFEETERDTYKVLWGEREKIGQPNGLLFGATSRHEVRGRNHAFAR